MKNLVGTLLFGALLATFTAFSATPASAGDNRGKSGDPRPPQVGGAPPQTVPQRSHNEDWRNRADGRVSQHERPLWESILLERILRERLERERLEREHRQHRDGWGR